MVFVTQCQVNINKHHDICGLCCFRARPRTSALLTSSAHPKRLTHVEISLLQCIIPRTACHSFHQRERHRARVAPCGAPFWSFFFAQIPCSKDSPALFSQQPQQLGVKQHRHKQLELSRNTICASEMQRTPRMHWVAFRPFCAKLSSLLVGH